MSFQDNIRLGNTKELERQIEADPALVNLRDEKGFPPIILATYFDQPQVTRLLLEKGAEVDGRYAAGNTALMGVCFKGNMDITRMLISEGADVNARNSGGTTPLIFAAMFEQLEVTQLLLQNGADKTMRDAQGNFAYTYAEKKENQNLMTLLKE